MEEYLVMITCEDISIFKIIINENGKILDKNKGNHGRFYCFNAILTKNAMEKIQHLAHIEIKQVGKN